MDKNKHIDTGIGFKNFKKFSNETILDLGDISFLIGKNNSGKSTVVKALFLMINYLKKNDYTKFSFNADENSNSNSVTFGRSKNSKIKSPYIDFRFYFLFGNEIYLKITGEDDYTEANVIQLHLSLTSGLKMEIDFLSNKVKYIARSQFSVDSVNKDDGGNNEMFYSTNDLNNNIYQVEFDFKENFENRHNNVILDITEYCLEATRQNVGNKFESFEYKFFLEGYKEMMVVLKSFLYNALENLKIVYIAATPYRQSALFRIGDKGNPLAQVIHDYYQLRISKDDEEYKFIQKWMMEFEIGEDFTINMYANEACEFLVEKDGVLNHLSDMGMGSLQAMLIILKIATNIRADKSKPSQEAFSNILFVIEEPELNLHPALQSKLTVLFHEAFINYGFKFIIETHSEYIVRKSQLIGLENNYFEKPQEVMAWNSDEMKYESILLETKNPFRVHYFPVDGEPYEMKYMPQGNFDKDFGPGFFDEATKTNIERIKMIRNK